MQATNHPSGIITIKELLSANECAAHIQFGEEMGFYAATVQSRDGVRLIEEVRNNDRIIFDEFSLAHSLYNRLSENLPARLNDWAVAGLNERFRFYRYQLGQYFKWHKDDFFVRNESEVSLLTLLIFLNSDFEGGATEFQWDRVQPETGMALIFPHKMRHQGAEIVRGSKYVLRTDVMYRKVDG